VNTIAIILVIALILFTIGLSIFSRRFTRTTADFYLAGRKVGSFANASAISGDYLSAASFLGVAGAIYASGLDGIWYAAGFAGGFMVVVLFIASPLRRFGEYTVADFAFGRFGSNRIRLITVLAVVLTSLFYMAPQMYGAGTTWQVLVGGGILGMDAYTSGVVVVAAIIAFYVAVGGMKGTTMNQIFQFWWLAFAMILVVIFAFGNGFNYPEALEAESQQPIVNTKAYTAEQLMTPDDAGITPYDRAAEVMTAEEMAEVDEFIESGAEGTIPVAFYASNKLHPEREMLFNEPGHRYNGFDQFSMVLALVLGTAGLPHILNRYYTNPSGKAARRSTFWVLVFISVFYVGSTIAGLAGLGIIREFLADGGTVNAATVHELLTKPDQLMPALGEILGGQWLMGIVASGAFAAMFSTVAGLLIASASALGHDVYEKYINKDASEAKRVAFGKIAVLMFAGIALLIGLAIPYFGLDQAYPALIAMMVTWAFSVGASAFVPMLLTGIWWKGTTEKGATAGMVVGLVGSILIIFLNILQQLGTIGHEGILGFIGSLTYPVLFTFPLSLLTIIIVSKLDGQLPKNVDHIWMRIHGTASERYEQQYGLDKVGTMFAKSE